MSLAVVGVIMIFVVVAGDHDRDNAFLAVNYVNEWRRFCWHIYSII